MFAKLLKYEFRKSKGVLGLLTLVMLGLALLVTIFVKYAVKVESAGGEISSLVTALMVPTLILAVLSLIGYSVCAFLIPLVQFYRSNFTDEGYLTFTLPTTPHHIYLASLTNMLIWEIISLVTMVLGVLMVVFLGTSPDQFFNTGIITGIQEATADPYYAIIMEEMTSMLGLTSLNTAAYIAQILVGFVSSLVLSTTAVVIGCTVAKKHKVAASVGFYFLLSYGVSTVSNAVTMSTAAKDVLSYSTQAELTAYMNHVMTTTIITGLVINLVILVGGYILSTQLMKRKLNLP